MISVVGSSNTDFTIKAERIPLIGETILGDDFFVACGGKGANQAMAIARLGEKVAFIAKIGTDSFGDKTINELKKSGVNTRYILRDKLHHSGIALILVDKKGDNVIAVFPGSNGFLGEEDVTAAEKIMAKSKALVLQLEIPLATIAKAIDLAYKNKVNPVRNYDIAGSKKDISNGVKVILNAAPAKRLPDGLLSKVDILILNEREIEILTQTKVKDLNTAYEGASRLLSKGVGSVVVTLGDKGAALITDEMREVIPAVHVKAVDTTAAGDAFTAALAVAVVEGKEISESVSFANRVAALTTTRMGAQNSLPTREEVENFYLKKC